MRAERHTLEDQVGGLVGSRRPDARGRRHPARVAGGPTADPESRAAAAPLTIRASPATGEVRRQVA